MGYRLHSDSFRDNCLLEKKVNDYKLFSREFDDFVKQSLGIPIDNVERRGEEELEFRQTTVSAYIENFLANHSFINRMEKLNIAMFDVELNNGRSLRVFATNTYFSLNTRLIRLWQLIQVLMPSFALIPMEPIHGKPKPSVLIIKLTYSRLRLLWVPSVKMVMSS